MRLYDASCGIGNKCGIETLGVSFIKGRDFQAKDLGRNVCIVSCKTERLLGYPPGKSVGQMVTAGREQTEAIGVVPDFDPFVEREDLIAIIYKPFSWMPPETLFIRSQLSRKDLEATIASVMREAFPGAAPGGIEVLSEVRGEQSIPHRRIIAMLAVFGSTAILLATLGLSALLSDSVSRRTREFGIRATLGATSGHLIGQVMLQGLWRTSLGVGMGLAVTLISGRYIQSLLFGIRSSDPRTLATVASLLLLLGLVSSFIPALRAASIDPAKALREE